MNSKIAVAIFIVALLLALIVKEGDCIQARTGKRSKEMPLNHKRSLCAAARRLDCDRELQDEPGDWSATIDYQ